MRIPPKAWKLAGIALLALIAVGLVVRAWVVPAVIARQMEARYAGKVKVGGWWLGGSSAGITGLQLFEEGGGGKPWATVESVETDLSVGQILRGGVTPGVITLHAPKLAFNLDEAGRPTTRIPLKSGGGGGGTSATLPKIVVKDATVTIAQEGRAPMVVTKVEATLSGEGDREILKAEADDPTWGDWKVAGAFAKGFGSGDITLTSLGAKVDARKVRAIPFIPKEAWDNIEPTGAVDVAIDVALASGGGKVHTVVDLRGTTARIAPLDLTATGTTGKIVVDGGLVKIEGVRGQAVGGEVEAGGTLDFTKAEPTFDLDLDLRKIDIARAPKRWQLDEVGTTTGLLTGKVDLKAVLAKGGVDLAGTTGDAVIEGATLQDIPVKALRLSVKGQGDDLQYEQGKGDNKGAALQRPAPIALVALRAPAGEGPEVKASVKVDEPKAKAKTGGFHLPKSLSTQIELEDVDLKKLATKAAAMHVHIPVPVAGKLSLKAEATIPLGDFRDVKEYKFKGAATLSGASIDGVDLGNIQFRLVLEDGVLDLTDFRGQLVDLPDGGVHGRRPEATAPVPAEGALPPGGFRGGVHAELSPPGKLAAHFEGQALPVGELAAPALPKPTPLSGLLTFALDAKGDLDHASDPKSWDVSGHASSERITYQNTTLDALSTTFSLKNGQLDVPDLAARLAGKPLTGRLKAGMDAPYAFDGHLDVADWDLSDVLTLVPGAPRPAPADGLLTARAGAKGTLSPRDIQTDGEGKIARFRAGAIPLGDVPFRWKTAGDSIVADIPDAHTFGGTLSAHATVPAKGEGPIRAAVVAKAIDTAEMTALMPDEKLKLTGKADGKLDLLVPSKPAEGAAQVEANLKLNAPDLTIQGVPAEAVAATAWVRKGVIHYEVAAESLGGKLKFKGDLPMGATAPTKGKAPAVGNGELKVVKVGLGGAWAGLGMGGSLGMLDGEASLGANVRTVAGRPGLFARAVAEVRDLRWGKLPLGWVKGTLAMNPTAWRIDPLEGSLLGGSARGTAWGETPAKGPGRTEFEVAIDRVALADALAGVRGMARKVHGEANLRLAGRLDEGGVHANGEVNIAGAKAFGLPVTQLTLPIEVGLAHGSGAGAFHARRFHARIAGGKVDGEAKFQLGADHGFDGKLHLAAIDLETLSRIETDAKKPMTGRLSGTITWSGRDPRVTRGLRGKVDLDLDDASLFELPVFKQLSRFLGGIQGGVFEDGDLHASLGERELSVEQLTLEGKIIQMHATGTVGYNQQLNLEVLVNTNRLIPESGQALVRLIPGLSDAGNRNQASQRVGGFLSNKLLKFRVTGSIGAPQVNADPAILVGETAVGFFGGVLKLPLNLLR